MSELPGTGVVPDGGLPDPGTSPDAEALDPGTGLVFGGTLAVAAGLAVAPGLNVGTSELAGALPDGAAELPVGSGAVGVGAPGDAVGGGAVGGGGVPTPRIWTSSLSWTGVISSESTKAVLLTSAEFVPAAT